MALIVVLSMIAIGGTMALAEESEMGVLQGVVTDEEGNAVDGAIVEAIGPEDISAETEADGSYEILLEPGTYDVSAFDEETGDASEVSVVRIDPGDTFNLDITLESADIEPPGDELGTIVGTVVDEDGDPIPDVTVYAESDEEFTSDETDANGAFELTVSPGTYEVFASSEELGLASDPEVVDVGPEETIELDLTLQETDLEPPDDGEIEPPDDGEIEPPEGDTGTIVGTVVDDNRDPVADVTVFAESDEAFSMDETDANGAFELTVSPGAYEVFAFSEELEMGSETEEVDVDVDETITVDLELLGVDDGPEDSSYVVDTSVSHVGGPAPTTMPEVDTMDAASGQINIDLMDFEQENVQELSDLGISQSTEFEIEVEFSDFEPRAVIAVGQDVDWEVSGSTLTVTAKPLSAQWIEGNPDLDDWPEGEDDRADFAYNAMLSLLVLDMDFPEDDFDPEDHPLTGLTVATDAQVFSTPHYVQGEEDEPDSLEIMIGGPHLTVDGSENHGIYDAFLPQSLLDEWGVSSADELDAAYKGESTTFSATERSDGIAISLDVSYSVGTVGISPDIEAIDDDEVSDDIDENGDDEHTDEDGADDDGESDDADDDTANDIDDDTADDVDDDTADDVDDTADDIEDATIDDSDDTVTDDDATADDSTPAPGVLVTLLSVLGAAALLRSRVRNGM